MHGGGYNRQADIDATLAEYVSALKRRHVVGIKRLEAANPELAGRFLKLKKENKRARPQR